jgi:DNA-binding transcriptional regulator YiaG
MKPTQLKRARLKAKLSQEKAARINNVSTSTWQSWELGRRSIPIDFVLVLPKP